jgi:formin 2
MKPLYWTRIIAPPISTPTTITPTDEVDAAAAAEVVNAENDALAAKKKFELWQEIDETSIDNLDEFTELFSRQGVVPKPKEKTEKPVKVQSIKILDSKRSQSVGIFSRSLHVDFDEIEHAIYHCDTSVVSLEALQQIIEIKANPEELDQIKQVAQTDALLDAPEKFLLKISNITSFSERISCIILQAEFDEAVTIVSRKLETIKQLCIYLMDNEDLKTLFSIILTLGNYMNGGNRTRGQADGFGLEILPKLKDVKSKDSKITLLHFIVKTYISQCRKRGTPLTEIVLPIPDPTDINKCVSIDFEDSKVQLTVLKNKLTGKSEALNVLRQSYFINFFFDFRL